MEIKNLGVDEVMQSVDFVACPLWMDFVQIRQTFKEHLAIVGISSVACTFFKTFNPPRGLHTPVRSASSKL
jgi:hypothetical protein